jgi:hypothetical protein
MTVIATVVIIAIAVDSRNCANALILGHELGMSGQHDYPTLNITPVVARS